MELEIMKRIELVATIQCIYCCVGTGLMAWCAIKLYPIMCDVIKKEVRKK